MLNQVSLSGSRARRGFTLLELIVVITIIGLLGTIVVVQVRGIGPKARRTKIDADSKNILTVAETLYTANGRYPETIAEMVNAKDENGADAMASLGEIPKDPWGSEYIYDVIHGRPTVTCLGSDKQQGGTDGEAMDIVRPEQEEGLR
ncbi:MAG TPA: type II secretion system protein GspG [Planctomycetota bacterium]|nr:type II secretion system protein GspG [Planctomycetota bacterium]